MKTVCRFYEGDECWVINHASGIPIKVKVLTNVNEMGLFHVQHLNDNAHYDVFEELAGFTKEDALNRNCAMKEKLNRIFENDGTYKVKTFKPYN